MLSEDRLREWNKKLEAHFCALRELRAAEAPGQPIFALEHGLEKDELTALQNAIQIDVAIHAPSWDQRLAWVVYATEIGYEYSGDEYWQTFENCTPGWLLHGDRHWIRDCFSDFHECYGGARPLGAWARHFTIICWPITHAILPHDLQRQLAKILFDISHILSSDMIKSPHRLGELISAHSDGTTTRFRQLAQEPLLLGQVAAALLQQEHDTTTALLLPSALKRIREDLDRERQARTWLRGARERVDIRFTRLPGSQREAQEPGTLSTRTTIGLRPHLLLRPSGNKSWDLWIELPDLSPALVKLPGLKDVLQNTRCRVTGSSGRRKPGMWLLSGPQSIKIVEWPGSNEPLLKYEQSSPELEDYLKEFIIHPGPTWLFRIGNDGLAHELRNNLVRPGYKYLLLSTKRINSSNGSNLISRVDIQCSGIQGIHVTMPETINSDLEKELNAWGVKLAGSVEAWPVGLAPGRWDGEDTIEWLTNEKPFLGLRTNIPINSYLVKLDEETLEVASIIGGEPVYLELSELSLGTHSLQISTIDKQGNTSASEILEITIRQPLVWSAGSNNSQSALLVMVNPFTPTLEDIWEDAAEIEVHGPTSKIIDCILTFQKKGENAPFLKKCLGSLRLPVTINDWRKAFGSFKETPEIQNSYDLAHSCTVIFQAGELGEFVLSAQREFKPLRWVLHRTRDEYYLRLMDDSGSVEVPDLERFEFEHPDKGKKEDLQPYVIQDGANVLGGLYVGKSAAYTTAIVAPRKVKALGDLSTKVDLASYPRTPQAVISLIKIMSLWTEARISGELETLILRRPVILQLANEIFGLIGGRGWRQVSDAITANIKNNPVELFKLFFQKKDDEIQVASIIANKADELLILSPEERSEFLANTSSKFLILPNEIDVDVELRNDPHNLFWLSQCALRLASCSRGTEDWVGNNMFDTISQMLILPGIPRLARFMVLLLARNQETMPFSGQIFEEWDWQ